MQARPVIRRGRVSIAGGFLALHRVRPCVAMGMSAIISQFVVRRRWDLRNDILERLRIDPGQRTLGQLLQDREAAIHEIARLRSDAERLPAERSIASSPRAISPRSALPEGGSRKPPFRSGTLIRLADVCELLGMSRSTVYKLLSEGRFPEPVRVGVRSVRWRVDAVEAWRDALGR